MKDKYIIVKIDQLGRFSRKFGGRYELYKGELKCSEKMGCFSSSPSFLNHFSHIIVKVGEVDLSMNYSCMI